VVEEEEDVRAAVAWAVKRLRAVGWSHVADRLDTAGKPDLDRTPACIAIMAAVDAVDCRRAARLDPGNAERWLMIAEALRGCARRANNSLMR
jgi:hypothetical protein